MATRSAAHARPSLRRQVRKAAGLLCAHVATTWRCPTAASACRSAWFPVSSNMCNDHCPLLWPKLTASCQQSSVTRHYSLVNRSGLPCRWAIWEPSSRSQPSSYGPQAMAKATSACTSLAVHVFCKLMTLGLRHHRLAQAFEQVKNVKAGVASVPRAMQGMALYVMLSDFAMQATWPWLVYWQRPQQHALPNSIVALVTPCFLC